MKERIKVTDEELLQLICIKREEGIGSKEKFLLWCRTHFISVGTPRLKRLWDR